LHIVYVSEITEFNTEISVIHGLATLLYLSQWDVKQI
jgi:hypothetical protein